jgi:hypothetical protein
MKVFGAVRKVLRYQMVMRRGKLKKDRQHNFQKKKHKGTNSDLQNTTQRTKD